MLVLKTIIALIVFALGLFSYLEGISQLHKKKLKVMNIKYGFIN